MVIFRSQKGSASRNFGKQWLTPWHSSFGEDKILSTVPGVEKRLLSHASLALVIEPNKVLLHTALSFLEGPSALTEGEDRRSPILTYMKNRKGKQYDKEKRI